MLGALLAHVLCVYRLIGLFLWEAQSKPIYIYTHSIGINLSSPFSSSNKNFYGQLLGLFVFEMLGMSK
jgi:hypothetical protein